MKKYQITLSIGLILIILAIVFTLHYRGAFNRIHLTNTDPYLERHFGAYPESGILILETMGFVDTTKYYKAIVTPEEAKSIIRGVEADKFSIPRSAPLWFHIKETNNTEYYITDNKHPNLYIYEPSTGELLVECNL